MYYVCNENLALFLNLLQRVVVQKTFSWQRKVEILAILYQQQMKPTTGTTGKLPVKTKVDRLQNLKQTTNFMPLKSSC